MVVVTNDGKIKVDGVTVGTIREYISNPRRIVLN